jgi:hypothetical protein
MIAITVSVNYSDILNILLPQNVKFFELWYIVTHKDDKKTIELIEKYNYKNVKILYFDVYKNAKFNKGGAIKYAQSLIKQDEIVLLLDSDIYIPNEFSYIIDDLHQEIKHNEMYSAKRYDYHTYENFINNKHDAIYNLEFVGYFQLYKNQKHMLYEDSDNCRNCDYNFWQNNFSKSILINNIILKHLGKEYVNHDGRTTNNFIPENLNNYLLCKNINDYEGNSQQVPNQIIDLIELTSKPNINIMEIGFNAGHSAEIFLKNNPTLNLTSFDIGEYSSVKIAKEYIDLIYTNRHQLILGDSTQTIPRFIEENKNVKFDFIFIDGGHSYEVAKADIENCFKLSHKDTIVVVDDTIYTSGWEAFYTIGPTKAWIEFINENKIRELGRKEYLPQRGMSWGKYIFEE